VVRRTFAGLVLLLLLAAGCDRGQHPEQVNTVAPSFSISDGSQSADLAKLHGKIVVLNFWATWCPPCIEELPSLMELQRRMPQVAVVAISTDQDEAAYKRFLADHHVELTTVRDGQQRVNALYGSFRYPETYVIDRNGMLRRKFIGPQTWTSPEIMEYLAKL
jgi:cytochrome c biogenesis protein CcmG, thiol:disulfide interchange protein DsbE